MIHETVGGRPTSALRHTFPLYSANGQRKLAGGFQPHRTGWLTPYVPPVLG